MRFRARFIVCLFILCILPAALHARGGGGCLAKGTPVLAPGGAVPVELLRAGDVVFGAVRNELVPVTVQAVFQVESGAVYDITVNGTSLILTAEHPVAVAPGVFRTVSSLKQGDTVLSGSDGRLHRETIGRIQRLPRAGPAYNILVSPAGTYLANNILVHNKGCFLPETLIRLADGTDTPISSIRPHDQLLAFTPDGGIVHASVRRVLTHEVNEYRIVRTADREFHVTPEHPFYTGSGTFRTLEALGPGDEIFMFDGAGLSSAKIESIETVRARTAVYNIETDAPNTFFADGAAVHNKGGGGCFPAGTLITTPRGDVPIERLSAGDTVTGIDRIGRLVPVVIQGTQTTRSALLHLKTGRGPFTTTEEHPLARSLGKFVRAGELLPGGTILFWNGMSVAETPVISTTVTNSSATVYNISVEKPHTFIANGFIVHNKGGGGGGFRSGGVHSRGGSSGSQDDGMTAFFIIFTVAAVIIIIAYRTQRRGENLDYLFSPADIAAKQEKTEKLIAFIARQDPSVSPETLRTVTGSTFLKLQQCWQSREYEPLRPFLMPDLYKEHLSQIQGMVRNHEINMIDELAIDRIDLVHIRYTLKPEEREFTALITARARDYYIDDRTRLRLRGDDTVSPFQEFWTFHFMNASWLLREIEQTSESDILKEDNFFEQVTDKSVDQIYGGDASAAAPAGPWLEKEVESKETRIERMLNFLVKTDKLWDRKGMLLAARSAFLDLTAAWETGDPVQVPSELLYP
ncbi:MAG TPA: Hint domain-containing protein, partial [Nitrospirota bacterium]|nr:Hint domain-containing protein [Nitrospirota bacterium]